MFDDYLLIVGLLVHFSSLFFSVYRLYLFCFVFFLFHIKKNVIPTIFYNHHYYYYYHYHFELLSDCFPSVYFIKSFILAGTWIFLLLVIPLAFIFFLLCSTYFDSGYLTGGRQFDRKILCICLDYKELFLIFFISTRFIHFPCVFIYIFNFRTVYISKLFRYIQWIICKNFNCITHSLK